MLTSLGKFLRKLRIDHGEILKNMAEKLNVTASFLSAVENGKKSMPTNWNNQICDLYHLDEVQQIEFTKAIAESEKKIAIDFTDSSFEQRELAIAFARKFSDLNDHQSKRLIDILHGGNNDT